MIRKRKHHVLFKEIEKSGRDNSLSLQPGPKLCLPQPVYQIAARSAQQYPSSMGGTHAHHILKTEEICVHIPSVVVVEVVSNVCIHNG
jgi:hypothetical protein